LRVTLSDSSLICCTPR